VINEEHEVLEEIRRILAGPLEYTEPVFKHSVLLECEALDSLGLITLAVGLEDRFRVKLSEEDAPELTTFGDVIGLVNRRRREAGR
jgi:acyl carrier protein